MARQLTPKELIRRIFKLLYSTDVIIVVRYLKNGELGQCLNESEPIIIYVSPLHLREVPDDETPICPASSLIHEALHAIFPTWNEDTVKIYTKIVWERITPIQKLALYELVFEDR